MYKIQGGTGVYGLLLGGLYQAQNRCMALMRSSSSVCTSTVYGLTSGCNNDLLNNLLCRSITMSSAGT